MQQIMASWRGKISVGVLASVVLHLVISAVLLLGLPLEQTKPEAEESVKVELVPPEPEETTPEAEKPPEPPKEEAPQAKPEEPPPPEPENKPQEETAKPEGQPEEQKPAEPPTEMAKAEEAKPPEPPPAEEAPPEPEALPPEAAEPPPPQEQQQEQAAAPPPPPPPQAEPEQQEKPPEPPASEPQQQADPAEAAAAQQQMAQTGPPPEGAETRASSIPMFQGVAEYGEDNAGLRKTIEGDSSSEAPASVEDRPEEATPAEQQADAKPAPVPGDLLAEPAPSDEAAQPETKIAAVDPAAGSRVPDNIDIPTADMGGGNPQRDGPGSSADDGAIGIAVGPAAGKPDVKPDDKPPVNAPSGLKEAKTLFSQTEDAAVIATTAMGNIPRDMRGANLCATELRQQLLHDPARYQPEWLPQYRMPRGTVMDARGGAFRSKGQWYNVQFRCEVDEKVTKVVSFALEVGAPVPRSEWKARKFPAY